MEVQADWLMMQDVPSPIVVELDAALAAMGPGTPRLREDAATSDTVAVCKYTIAPLALFHPLLGSPFLTPINKWNMIITRAESLGLYQRVIPLLQWLRAQMSAHTGTAALYSVDLADATIQARKELRDIIIPPPPRHNLPLQYSSFHQDPQ